MTDENKIPERDSYTVTVTRLSGTKAVLDTYTLKNCDADTLGRAVIKSLAEGVPGKKKYNKKLYQSKVVVEIILTRNLE